LRYDALVLVRHAAANGHVDVIDWLLQQHSEVVLSSLMICYAAKNGHVAMCQYLCEHGCPRDTLACTDAAARNGHLDVLVCLLEYNSPWHEQLVCEYAAYNGHVEMMAYALQHAEQLPGTYMPRMLLLAGANDHLAAAQWLRQQGAEWPTSLQTWFSGRKLEWSGEVLAWARANGCTSPIQLPVDPLQPPLDWPQCLIS
jgi:Ankyrin repeats (3 copies)